MYVAAFNVEVWCVAFCVCSVFTAERTSKLGVLGWDCVVFVGYGVSMVEFVGFAASDSAGV